MFVVMSAPAGSITAGLPLAVVDDVRPFKGTAALRRVAKWKAFNCDPEHYHKEVLPEDFDLSTLAEPGYYLRQLNEDGFPRFELWCIEKVLHEGYIYNTEEKVTRRVEEFWIEEAPKYEAEDYLTEVYKKPEEEDEKKVEPYDENELSVEEVVMRSVERVVEEVKRVLEDRGGPLYASDSEEEDDDE